MTRAKPKPTKARYVGQLNSIEQCRREMARVYRDLRQNAPDEFTVSEGYQLMMMLVQLVKCIESSEIEKRLGALEANAPPSRRDRLALAF